VGGVGLLGIAIISLLSGFLARLVLRRPRDVFADLVLGVIGAFVGELAAQALDIPHADSFVGVLVAATFGSAVLLSLPALLRRRRKP
jgi:uncharacterized membrane protein YeaQ/YmgE (transglycosylase-associated protein family)